MTALPVDQEDRDRALDSKASFHLEAPAGSGKTSVLLARFLTLLAQVDAPEELLALTFTRKAAGELRVRIMQLLRAEAELKPDASPMEQRLAELAQEVFRHFSRRQAPLQEVLTPERLPVMTFHGFCARLLALAPQEAGVPLDFRLVEEQDAEWLKQEALEELRRRLAARPGHDPVRRALVNRLVRLNNNWSRLAGELRTLLDRRDTLQDFLALAQESRDVSSYESLMTSRLAAVLAPDLAALAAGLANSELGQRWPEFWEYLKQQQAPLAEKLSREPPRGRLEDLPVWQKLAEAILTNKNTVRKKFGPAVGLPSGFAGTAWNEALRALPDEFFEVLAKYRDLPPSLIFTEEVAALQDLILLLWEALAVYEELCRKRGVLDFIDLEMAAMRLLAAEDLSDLLLLLDRRLQHLLVDEFQDTSENQKTLLCRLLSGWDAEPGRTLFVVGDPKQSIYGWRRAKLSLFLESRRGLRCDRGFNFPLEPLRLVTNFRTTSTLIDWVNCVFETLMTCGPEPEKLDFQAASPSPAAQAGGPPCLALFIDDDNLASRQAEARWLAARLREAVRELKGKENIGVLLFARTHLTTYLKALDQAGLSVRVREGLKLSDSPVVQHLHNLARALVRPHDDLSWAALLAGPWGPQSQAVIAQAALTTGRLWYEKLGRLAAENPCPATLLNLVATLAGLKDQVGRAPLHQTLLDFLQAVGAWDGIAAWEGPAGVANARTYLELVADAESGLPETTFLKTDFSLAEAYQPPNPRAQDSPVELLTVHGAKGLEFDWVFVPYLDWQPLRKGSRTPPPFLLEEIPGSSNYGLALAPPYWQTSSGLLYQSLKRLRDARTLAEARRVFYVAATRAKKHLFLSGILNRDKEGRLKPPADSPLTWLWQHYRPGDLTTGQPVTLAGPDLQVEIWEEYPEIESQDAETLELPEALSFTPEPAPYAFAYPSQLAKEAPERLETESGSVEAPPGFSVEVAEILPRVRGEVMHSLLENASYGGPLPEVAGVAAALRQGGLDRETADRLAPEILAEAAACLGDPFLVRLLASGAQVAKSEWLLEDAPEDGVIRRGKIDRLAYDGENWWLVDYKTSRPAGDEGWETFMAGEAEKYRPQLLAYRDMAAKALGVPPEDIHPVIYFTACQRAVMID
ncbi:MAG: UvrD-helicase domain-containing protein [Deltaproteobacteria bacterium]|nr:UvrD-helicase domain-containing protein [Deltaproteobacteria bacterium]